MCHLPHIFFHRSTDFMCHMTHVIFRHTKQDFHMEWHSEVHIRSRHHKLDEKN